MILKTEMSHCPIDETRDTTDSNSVPFVPCPTNETALFNSVLAVEVSCFANYNSPNNPRTVSLLKWLISAKYSKKVEAIRATTDKKERDRIKATLPAITPSGLFNRREASALVQHSHLICLDIDLKGNEGIANYNDLKQQLCKIKNIAYCGQSVSGTGYFVLIPIAFPYQHSSQFKALRDIFQKKFGVLIDSTPDVSRLRGYSYDPSGYFNHQATPFRGVYIPPAPIPAKKEKFVSSFVTGDFASVVLQRCIRLIEEAGDGEKHAKLNLAAYTVGGYIASGILDEANSVAALEAAIERKPNVADFRAASRTIRTAIQQGKQQPLYQEVQEVKIKKTAVPFVGRGTNGTVQKNGTNVELKTKEIADNKKPVPIVGHGTVNEQKTAPYVKTIADQLLNPSSILKPDESQLEHLTVDSCDTYPAEWDSPSEPDAQPKIKSTSFFEWQRTNPYFSQLGLASLQTRKLTGDE